MISSLHTICSLISATVCSRCDHAGLSRRLDLHRRCAAARLEDTDCRGRMAAELVRRTPRARHEFTAAVWALPSRRPSAHATQKVHSNEQILASADAPAGRCRSIRSWVAVPACRLLCGSVSSRASRHSRPVFEGAEVVDAAVSHVFQCLTCKCRAPARRAIQNHRSVLGKMFVV